MAKPRRSTWYPPARRWTEDDARGALDAWRRSGLGGPTFAREHGITAQRLYWWRDRLTTASAALVSLVPGEIVGAAEPDGDADRGRLVVRAGDAVIEISEVTATWVAALVRELTRLA